MGKLSGKPMTPRYLKSSKKRHILVTLVALTDVIVFSFYTQALNINESYQFTTY